MIGQKVYEDKFEIQIAQKLKAKKSDSSKIKKLIYFTLLNLSSKLACSNLRKSLIWKRNYCICHLDNEKP